ncbi:PKD domain-containing protein [Telluribacter sp. SYSU D00476]|uniref:PKD domain-containing protein n=1 Tax=Telluribacter sp. SYSU D00476 TaxID=2811430 RepID=UPI001FF19782|nr:PKD domain-containing protein [Telluribacter sp. SYSU D00476]
MTCDAPHEERNGLVVIEAENLNLPSGWQKKSATSGYTGSGYIEWTGASSFSKPGVGLIETTVKINKTGKYYFRWHNRVGKGTSGSEHNDSWLRLPDASNFYAEKGTYVVYPHGSGKTPNPKGAGSGGWFKIFTNGGLKWNWATVTSDHENLLIVAEFNSPGVYRIQISARSDGHLIDRLVMHHSSVSTTTALALTNPETTCTGEVVASNQAPTANAGADKTIALPTNSVILNGSGSDSDGSIASYQWNQQSGPSQASLSNVGTANLTAGNLVAGTYVFRLTVKDNQGATATNDASVKVNPEPATSTQQVVSFTLMNADNEQPIRELTANDVLNLATLPTKNLSIRANTNPDRVGSVKMILSGQENRTQTETGFPYSLFGDEAGNYNAWTPAVGDYRLTGTPYTERSATGTAGTPLSITFKVVEQAETTPAPAPAGQQVVSFTLMNADNEQPIRELTAGDVLDLASLPTRNLSIRANTNPDRVGSVKMILSGQQSRTQIETGFPYSLFGDEAGNYNAWTPAVGDYRLTGTPYTERSATGTAGTPFSITFKITNTSAARTTAALMTCDAPHEERNGLVVIEAENLNLPSGWQKKSATSGYTGSGYIEWTGASSFSKPGVGLIETTVKINKTGKYYFRWHNRVGKGTSGSEHNDSWLRLPDASNFYAEKGTYVVYPHGSGKTPNPKGAGSGGWFKIFTNGGLKWNWATVTSDHENLLIVAEFNSPGVYRIQISARSDGHLIDRLVMHHSSVSTTTALALTNPETTCTGEVVASNQAPTANAGADKTIALPTNSVILNGSGSDSDGSIASYQWNQQSGPSQASLSNVGTANLTAGNLVAGTYVFRLTVKDNQGATATNDASVKVNPEPATSTQQVVSFTLMNADNEQPIRELTANDVLNLATLPTKNLSIRANTNPDRVGSVKMILSGQENRTQTETGFPYSLFGDEAGNYNAWTPAVGDYRLTGTPYTERSATGTAGTPLSITFKVVEQAETTPAPAPAGQQVVSFTLMNADNEQPIRELTAGDVLDLASLPTRNLSIRANTNPDRVGSVKMILSGQQSRTQIETGFPYSLFGDEAGNYNAWTPAVGDYRLTGTPYTERSATGTAGTPFSITFKITNTSAARVSASTETTVERTPKITLYPNPTADVVTIDGVYPEADDFNLGITNGVLVHYPKYEVIASGSVRIAVDGMSPGTYIIQVKQYGKVSSHKLLIVR